MGVEEEREDGRKQESNRKKERERETKTWEIMEERKRRGIGALMNNPSADLKGKAASGFCSEEANHVGGALQRAAINKYQISKGRNAKVSSSWCRILCSR